MEIPAKPLEAPVTASAEAREGLEFDDVYRRWFADVSRWVRAHGIPDSDREDLTQEVFLVVRRRLAEFDGRSLPGWLYRITANVSGDHRRRAWFRNLMSRRGHADLEARPAAGSPEEDLARKQLQGELHALLDGLSDSQRVTLVLFEIEGYSGEEIARLHGVPVDTVWTRLHHARRRFRQLLEASPSGAAPPAGGRGK